MLVILLLLSTAPNPVNTSAELLSIEFTIPRVDTKPYFRPYVAIWIEDADRQPLKTLAIWYEQDNWLKDLRNWWRGIGRDNTPSYDGVAGATPKPQTHKVTWDLKDTTGKTVAPGTYFVLLEIAREEGGREFFRQKVQLGTKSSQHYEQNGDIEMGTIQITVP